MFHMLMSFRSGIPSFMLWIHAAFHIVYTVFSGVFPTWSIQQNIKRVQVIDVATLRSSPASNTCVHLFRINLLEGTKSANRQSLARPGLERGGDVYDLCSERLMGLQGSRPKHTWRAAWDVLLNMLNIADALLHVIYIRLIIKAIHTSQRSQAYMSSAAVKLCITGILISQPLTENGGKDSQMHVHGRE